MPLGDGTGPMGQGPLTGRGFGPCARGSRFGFRRGWRGLGWGSAAQRWAPQRDERSELSEAKRELEAELAEVTRRLEEMG